MNEWPAKRTMRRIKDLAKGMYVRQPHGADVWDEQETGKFLSRGKAVRLVGADGGIAISADRQSEHQKILDDANRRRAILRLAPVIPRD